MSRIAPVPANTETKVAAIVSQIKASLGDVPNVFGLLANAPVALDGYLSLSKALSRGRITDPEPGNLGVGYSTRERLPILPFHPYGMSRSGWSQHDGCSQSTLREER